MALEDKALAVEEKAVERYRIAYERSRELRIQNEWTQRTLEALNRLRQAEYPIDKKPLVDRSVGGTYSLDLVLPNGGAQLLQSMPGTPAVGANPSPTPAAGVPAAEATAEEADPEGAGAEDADFQSGEPRDEGSPGAAAEAGESGAPEAASDTVESDSSPSVSGDGDADAAVDEDAK